jgi:hypothetical protein
MGIGRALSCSAGLQTVLKVLTYPLTACVAVLSLSQHLFMLFYHFSRPFSRRQAEDWTSSAVRGPTNAALVRLSTRRPAIAFPLSPSLSRPTFRHCDGRRRTFRQPATPVHLLPYDRRPIVQPKQRHLSSNSRSRIPFFSLVFPWHLRPPRCRISPNLFLDSWLFGACIFSSISLACYLSRLLDRCSRFRLGLRTMLLPFVDPFPKSKRLSFLQSGDAQSEIRRASLVERLRLVRGRERKQRRKRRGNEETK